MVVLCVEEYSMFYVEFYDLLCSLRAHFHVLQVPSRLLKDISCRVNECSGL